MPQQANVRGAAPSAASGSGTVRQDTAQESTGCRQLKVEDALAYLEQVKSQFSSQPSVYNQFLDIMKEFKAQTIDTAEVIKRVSSLFAGRRNLILGFNTFLPPGYKIELRGDPSTGCVTGFSSPGGEFCALGAEEVPPPQQQDLQPGPPPPPPVLPDASAQQPGSHTANAAQVRQARGSPALQGPDGRGHTVPSCEHAYNRGHYVDGMQDGDDKNLQPGSMSVQGHATQHIGVMPGTENRGKATNDHAAATLAVGLSTPASAAVAAGKPIEFDQAVTYVNKIKSRFAEDEAVYKTFLDILQTYQKEQKSIEDVYQQVSQLFREHEDLLNEFSDFLPETPPQGQRLQSGTAKTSSDTNMSRGKLLNVKQQPIPEGGIPEHSTGGSYSSTWKGKDKSGKGAGGGRNRSGKGGNTPGPNGGIAKKGSSSRGVSGAPEGLKKGRRGPLITAKAESKLVPLSVSSSGAPIMPAKGTGPELEFFEELRSLLGEDGQQNYSEFIKCLSLFSQEIICGDELMRLVESLLNHRKPLTEAFKAFLDQSDPKATQSAVAILRRARAASDGASASGPGSRAGTPVATPSGVRDGVASLAVLDRLGVDGQRHGSGTGSRSPKVNPLYKGRPLSDIAREYGTALAETKSYAALPSDIGAIQSSGMTAEDRSVLNHLCVSAASGGPMRLHDDDSSKPGADGRDSSILEQRAGPQGKSAISNGVMTTPHSGDLPDSPRTVRNGNLGVEDERVELDLLIARAENTIAKLERFIRGELRSIASLTALDMKPVELIYRDSGIDIVEVLRSSPNVTAPVVLTRLRQRLSDWHGSRKKMEDIWKTKRFAKGNMPSDRPPSWQRRELVKQLQAFVKPRIEDPANRSVCKLNCDLVHNQENMDVLFDLLWYIFEWEADTADEADRGLKFLERVYDVVKRALQSGESIFADDYLYVCVRLMAEASQRIGYVLERNYDGVAVQRTIEKVRKVLGGKCDLLSFDDHCKNTYGEGRRWETLLCDFPVILKRLGSAALKIPNRQLPRELLDLLGDDKDGKNKSGSCEQNISPMKIDGEDNSNKETGNGLTKADSSERRMKRLRAAISLTSSAGCSLFEICVSREPLNASPEWKEQRMKSKPGERGVVLSFQYLPKETAAQFSRLVLSTGDGDAKQRRSSFERYLRRALKTARRTKLQARRDLETLQHDGLDVRENNASNAIHYVAGTEDFFMRTGRKRKAGDEMEIEENSEVPISVLRVDGTGRRAETAGRA